MRSGTSLVQLSLPRHSIFLAYSEQIEAIPFVLYCVSCQASNLNCTLFVFSESQRVLCAYVFKQIVNFLVVDLEEGTLNNDLMTLILDLLEDVKKHPRYNSTLLRIIDIL